MTARAREIAVESELSQTQTDGCAVRNEGIEAVEELYSQARVDEEQYPAVETNCIRSSEAECGCGRWKSMLKLWEEKVGSETPRWGVVSAEATEVSASH
jgi:hypothetical protein